MEHFPIVQAICRIAMSSPTDGLVRQLERLRDELQESGEEKQAKYITNLLSRSSKSQEMTPSTLVQSRMSRSAEDLTPATKPPVDKETSTPLATIVLPSTSLVERPIFHDSFHDAVSSLIDEWQNIEALLKMNVEPSRSCLIYGPPGTGKSHLATWIANQLGLPVVLAQLHGLMSSFLGTTARNINLLFEFADRYKCILLLDEFDAIAKLRDDPQEVGEIKRVVNALLQNLDRRKEAGLTIGITNHERLLDPAVWRRFEVQLAIPPPNFEVRCMIAKTYLPPLALSDSHVKVLSWLADGATGAEMESLVNAVKRSFAIGNDETNKLIPALQKFATTNSGRLKESRRALLFKSPVQIAEVLLADPELGFDQSDVAEIFGRNKATVSRWLSKARGAANEKGVVNG